MNSTFDAKDLSGKAKINDGNIAYNLRHKVHDNGKIGQQNAGYVSNSQTSYRWIQPKNTDDGVTASMGLVSPKKKSPWAMLNGYMGENPKEQSKES